MGFQENVRMLLPLDPEELAFPVAVRKPFLPRFLLRIFGGRAFTED